MFIRGIEHAAAGRQLIQAAVGLQTAFPQQGANIRTLHFEIVTDSCFLPLALRLNILKYTKYNFQSLKKSH